MDTIYLQNEISFEQYQEVVKMLNSLGIKVKEEKEFTDFQMKKIRKGIDQIEKGQTKSYIKVRKKAGEICGI